MHQLKIISHLKSFLSVTKKEWNGLVVMLVLIILLFAIPYIYKSLHKGEAVNSITIDKAVTALNRSSHKNTYTGNAKKIKNTTGRPSFAKKGKLTMPVEINSADSAKLTTIYGIGPAFARRIVRYRKRLGGFVNKEQLKEVYGLDEDKYNEISSQVTVNSVHLQKININTATFDDLKRLPYLSFKQMNAIIQYRIQHGDYASADDLKDIAILNDKTINKLKPYFVYDRTTN